MRFSFETLSFHDNENSGDKLAVAGSERDLSWSEFASHVELLGAKLRALDTGAPIVIYGHKEALFAVAIIACVANKIPYIPVDISFPTGRIEKIQVAAAARVVICTGSVRPDVHFDVVINNQGVISGSMTRKNVEGENSSNDPLCYVMFTSGSTGEPKGVMITHSAVRSFVSWMHQDYPIDAETVFMNQAAFTFDISLIDLFGAVSLGATLVLNSAEVSKQPGLLFERIRKYKCTFWNSTPSFVFLAMSHPEFTSTSLPSIKDFILLGEVLPTRTVRKIHESFLASRVFNAYGPTEATVATTIIEVTDEVMSAAGAELPIGYAKGGDSIVIENQVKDDLLEGEIIICGDHVGIGYINSLELTREKFFVHDNKRAYRTGDYGYLKNGVVFFNGRKDDQVKLHGYRIEVGEITDVLCRFGGVVDAVTLPLRSGGQVRRIIAFVRPDAEANITKEEILVWAAQQMPAYMVPSDIRFIDEFPVNSNHKVDIKKLTEIYVSGKV